MTVHQCDTCHTLRAELNGAKQAEAACRRERDELREAQAKWLLSPEAAKRLDGYRELAAKCAALTAERDEARAERRGESAFIERCELELHNHGESIDDGLFEAVSAIAVERDGLRRERDAALAEVARLREALEACGFWLHPHGLNNERRRLFDRITNAVESSHALYDFIRVTLAQPPPSEPSQLPRETSCAACTHSLAAHGGHATMVGREPSSHCAGVASWPHTPCSCRSFVPPSEPIYTLPTLPVDASSEARIAKLLAEKRASEPSARFVDDDLGLTARGAMSEPSARPEVACVACGGGGHGSGFMGACPDCGGTGRAR